MYGLLLVLLSMTLAYAALGAWVKRRTVWGWTLLILAGGAMYLSPIFHLYVGA
jgi:hypothetical protein